MQWSDGKTIQVDLTIQPGTSTGNRCNNITEIHYRMLRVDLTIQPGTGTGNRCNNITEIHYRMLRVDLTIQPGTGTGNRCNNITEIHYRMLRINKKYNIIITSERCERSSYGQSYIGRVDDIQTALKSFKKSERIEKHFYNHFSNS